MEKKIQINTPDGHIICGTLNESKTNLGKLIVFVHGLTGHQNEHQFFNASKFFPVHGFTTFRFDLYSGEKKGRKLAECSIKTHAKDLNLVVDHFKSNFKEIYLVGHSLGGLTVLWAELKAIKSIVLWDPSFDIKSLVDDLIFNECLDKYLLEWGTQYLISKEMVKEFEASGNDLINKIVKPTKIICSGSGVLFKQWKEKISEIKAPNEFIIIENAGHCFDEDGTEEKLFEETLSWFKK